MHIMALSGFNVGIIALVLGFLLGIFDTNLTGRAAKTLLIVLFIWLFAFVTGLSASVTRAAAMISLVMTGKLFHRQVNTYNILFASAFLLLAWSPGMLADVSFQLSFAAVAGIILYQPLLNRLIRFRNTLLSRTWQLFTVSCAAQLATFPISIYYFHQFPVYFWMTNLYVGPLVSIIICLAGLYLAVAWISPLAAILGKVLMLSLKGLYYSVSIVETLPCSLIDGIHINRLHAALLMGMVLTMALFLLFRKASWLCCCLFLMCLFLAMNVTNLMKLKRQQLCLVASIRGETAISLIQGRSAVLFADQGLQQGDTRLTYALGNFWVNHGVRPAILYLDSMTHISDLDAGMPGLFWKSGWRGENVLISFGEKRIIILRDDRFFDYLSAHPLRIDMVIVTGRVRTDMYRLIKEIKPGMIILDSSVGWTQAGNWIRQIEETGLKYHAVIQHGAYVSYLGGRGIN